MLDTQKVITAYKSGKTMKQISQEEHVTTFAISNIIRPLGLPHIA